MMIRYNRKRRRTAGANRMKHVLKGMGRLIAGTAGLAFILAGGWWLNQAWSVDVWTIRGVPAYLKKEIDTELSAMKTLDFIHAWPFRLRRELLTRLPDLEDVEIARRLPDRLEVTATQRTPVALWRKRDGKVSLVDGNAVPYRVLRRGEELDLPLIRAPRSGLDTAVKLLLTVQQENSYRYTHLSELIDEGTSWRINFDRGQSWLLPVGINSARRIRGLIALMRQKRWRGGNWRIDARLPARWFIRKSKIGGVV